MGELRLTAKVGFFMRRQVRDAVEEYCFQRGFGCEIWDKRYWFHYLVRVVVSAPDRYIPQVRRDLEFLLS